MNWLKVIGFIWWLLLAAAADYCYFLRDYIFYSAFLYVFMITGAGYAIRLAASNLPMTRQILRASLFWLPILPALFAEKYLSGHVITAPFWAVRIVAGGLLIWAVVMLFKTCLDASRHLSKICGALLRTVIFLPASIPAMILAVINLLVVWDTVWDFAETPGKILKNRMAFSFADGVYYAKHFIFYHVPLLPDEDFSYTWDWWKEIMSRPYPFNTCSCLHCDDTFLSESIEWYWFDVNNEFGSFVMLSPAERKLQRSVHHLWLSSDHNWIQFGRTWTPGLYYCNSSQSENEQREPIPFIKIGRVIANPHIFHFTRNGSHYIAAVAMSDFSLGSSAGPFEYTGNVELHIWKDRMPFVVHRLIEYEDLEGVDVPSPENLKSRMSPDGVIHLEFPRGIKYAIPITSGKTNAAVTKMTRKTLRMREADSSLKSNGK